MPQGCGRLPWSWHEDDAGTRSDDSNPAIVPDTEKQEAGGSYSLGTPPGEAKDHCSTGDLQLTGRVGELRRLVVYIPASTSVLTGSGNDKCKWSIVCYRQETTGQKRTANTVGCSSCSRQEKPQVSHL